MPPDSISAVCINLTDFKFNSDFFWFGFSLPLIAYFTGFCVSAIWGVIRSL